MRKETTTEIVNGLLLEAPLMVMYGLHVQLDPVQWVEECKGSQVYPEFNL
jgi:hypothetical protein